MTAPDHAFIHENIAAYLADALDPAQRAGDTSWMIAPEDVAEAILWAVSRPEHVNIARVSLTSVQQANSLLFHREA